MKIFILFIALQAATWIAPQRASAQVSVDFQVFYDDLSPYGNWVDNADYGYVWVPRVSRRFSPYSTNGYWVFTDEGWTWVSNYSWGWAPFHYGRWFYDPYYRWIWVPDNEWGPGWVSWRRSDSYYGWAPLGPGISIDIAYGSGYRLPSNQWTFVRNRDFGRTNINNYYVNSSSNTTIINNTTVINNTRSARSNNVKYNAGPERNEVEQRAGRQFKPVVLRERSKPGHTLARGELQIYRPQVEKNVSTGRKPVPSRVGGWKNVKPAVQGNTTVQPQRENPTDRERSSQGQGNNSRPIRQEPSQPQRSDRPVPEQRRNDQPAQPQPRSQQRQEQPVKQPAQHKRDEQPARQEPPQHKRDEQPARQQPPQQRRDQPVKPQQPPQQRRDQPVKPQQPPQQKREQPARQQPPQQRRDQPVKQQPSQQKHDGQPKKDQPRRSGVI